MAFIKPKRLALALLMSLSFASEAGTILNGSMPPAANVGAIGDFY
jgi:hypothetical protein